MGVKDGVSVLIEDTKRLYRESDTSIAPRPERGHFVHRFEHVRSVAIAEPGKRQPKLFLGMKAVLVESSDNLSDRELDLAPEQRYLANEREVALEFGIMYVRHKEVDVDAEQFSHSRAPLAEIEWRMRSGLLKALRTPAKPREPTKAKEWESIARRA